MEQKCGTNGVQLHSPQLMFLSTRPEHIPQKREMFSSFWRKVCSGTKQMGNLGTAPQEASLQWLLLEAHTRIQFFTNALGRKALIIKRV